MDRGAAAAGTQTFDRDRRFRYAKTIYAKQGDHGSGLPRQPAGATWQAGSRVEAKWSIRANHGGGYASASKSPFRRDKALFG